MPTINVVISVANESHDPVQEAKVSLFDGSNQLIGSNPTDTLGKATFTNNYEGEDPSVTNWKAVVEKTGFRSVGFSIQQLNSDTYAGKGFGHIHAFGEGEGGGGDNGGGGDPPMINVTVTVKAMTINDGTITLSNTPVEDVAVKLYNATSDVMAAADTDANGVATISIIIPNGVTNIDGWYVLIEKTGYQSGVGADIQYSATFTGSLTLYTKSTT